MESFYQAIGSPLQIMLVGDPLACPGAPGARIELLRPDAGGDPGAVTLRASVWGEPGSHYGRFVFLLDGRVAGEGRTLRLDTAGLSDGPHTVRCVAYRTGLVRSQAFAEKTIAVANGKLAP
jgi:hypothetical protein